MATDRGVDSLMGLLGVSEAMTVDAVGVEDAVVEGVVDMKVEGEEVTAALVDEEGTMEAVVRAMRAGVVAAVEILA